MTEAEPGHGAEGDLPKWAQVVPADARSFQGHRAGFVTRFLAASLDFALVGVFLLLAYVGWAILLFVSAPTTFTLPSVSFGLVLAAGAALSWLTFTTAWATTGRTFGSKILGIRVVNYDGTVMRWPGAAIRGAFCVFFLPGLFWVIVSHENRSLQDTVLRTSVIYDWTSRSPDKQARPGHTESSQS